MPGRYNRGKLGFSDQRVQKVADATATGVAYAAAVSLQRLSRLPDGRLVYRVKRTWSDGSTDVVYEPRYAINCVSVSGLRTVGPGRKSPTTRPARASPFLAAAGRQSIVKALAGIA